MVKTRPALIKRLEESVESIDNPFLKDLWHTSVSDMLLQAEKLEKELAAQQMEPAAACMVRMSHSVENHLVNCYKRHYTDAASASSASTSPSASLPQDSPMLGKKRKEPPSSADEAITPPPPAGDDLTSQQLI